MTRSIPAAASILLSLLASGLRAQPLPRGNELQVTHSTQAEVHPAVAAAGNGGFEVVWLTEQEYIFGPTQVSARRFDALATALGGQAQLQLPALAFHGRPVIATTPDQGVIVVWHGGVDGSGLGVQARRLDAVGDLVGVPFHVNTYTTHNQSRPAVAVADDGDFVVVWQSYGQFGTGYGIVGRRFDSSGAAQTAEFQISVQTLGQNQDPAVATLPNGEFVVAWNGKTEIGYYYPIFARRFDAAGVSQATQFQVSSATLGGSLPAVAARADGAFVIVWQSYRQDGFGWSVQAQLFDASGDQQGSTFLASPSGSSSASEAAIAMSAAGGFIVAWQTHHYGGGGSVFARSFTSSGEAVAAEFQVNVHTTEVDRFPSIASQSTGHYVLAWQRSRSDPVQPGFVDHRILIRRFADSLAILDVDGDGNTEALTDAILVLRQRLGFSGPALVTGAVGPACTRCDEPAIETYIASILTQLDVDGDGSVDVFTDGLLILRFAFGFRGEVLILDAVGEDCTRCDAESIEAVLIPLYA